jgi:hypothetical protein
MILDLASPQSDKSKITTEVPARVEKSTDDKLGLDPHPS